METVGTILEFLGVSFLGIICLYLSYAVFVVISHKLFGRPIAGDKFHKNFRFTPGADGNSYYFDISLVSGTPECSIGLRVGGNQKLLSNMELHESGPFSKITDKQLLWRDIAAEMEEDISEAEIQMAVEEEVQQMTRALRKQGIAGVVSNDIWLVADEPIALSSSEPYRFCFTDDSEQLSKPFSLKISLECLTEPLKGTAVTTAVTWSEQAS